MRSTRIGVPAVGVIVALAALAGCGSSSTHGEEGTLTLTQPGTETAGSFGVIGKATKKGIEPGNGFAFYAPLENSAGKTVGELNATCIATQPSPGEGLNGTCSGTAMVPGGGFAVNVGGKEIARNIKGAIVGGTGKYAGAVGTFSSKAIEASRNSPEELTFDYTLP
jgi:hypothetical protein